MDKSYSELVRSRPDLIRFFELVDLKDLNSDLRLVAFETGLEIETVQRLTKELVEVGFWKIEDSKVVKVLEDQFFTNKASNFILLQSQNAALLSDEGPCVYDYATVASNMDLLQEYEGKFKALFREFISRSKKSQKRDVLAEMTFTMVDVYGAKNLKKREKSQ
jgi:hypothetical protein